MTSVRMVIDMQEKHSHRKGCVLFVVHISNDKIRRLRMHIF